MASVHPPSSEPPSAKPLRLWPGVVLVALQLLLRYAVPAVAPETFGFGVMAGLAGGVLVLVWWLFFSRAPWIERIGAIVLMVVMLIATKRVVHPSIANGAMGMLLIVATIPLLSLGLVAWAAVSRRLAGGRRIASLLGVTALICAAMTLLRTGGLSGSGGSDFHWRWTPTPEERLIAQSGKGAAASRAPKTAVTTRADPPSRNTATTQTDSAARVGTAEWPGFRGPQRDSIVRGLPLATDWSRSAPVEMWRRAVGPGWSSFAVHGDFIYTQEQRGDDEMVACYQLATGAPVWSHADAARFWESNGGAGPRGTPTLSGGRVYTCGATGIVNALDARTGSIVWSRNAASDTGRKLPGWGFSSSPVIVGDRVIVATAGVLAGYDLATGAPRWTGPKGGYGYSSPHLSSLHGVEQIVLLNGTGVISVTPADGKVLWQHEWKSDGIVQPAVMAGGDILLGSGSGLGVKVGLRRVAITNGPAGWAAEERWTSPALKPYFNDFVVHKGHAYGFDGTTLACLDLTDGGRKWKGGRYGNGQIVLLAGQDLLLVLSEKGELALVGATSDAFKELGRVPAIKGKTWNHPVVVGNVALVRNGEEMAAFRLP